MRKAVWTLVVGAIMIAVPSQALAGSPVAGHLRVAIDSASQTADFSRTAARQRVVVLHEWEQGKMHDLKASDPTVKVLVYKNLSGMMAAAPYAVASTGVTTEEAAAHPDWYLLNTSGERFTFGSYGWVYAADVANPSYQRAWAANVLKVVKDQGWDGVFADDTNPTIRHHYDVGSVAKYPTDATYGAAMGKMLAAVGPSMRAEGKLIIPNMGSWSGYRNVVDSWLQYVDGGMEEMFVKWGNDPATGYATGNDWEQMLGAIKATESRGKMFLGVTHSANNDAAAARYGWATMLLAAQGRSSFALHADYTNETWFSEYDIDLGAATGNETRETSGVHRRVFTKGLVLVNPTTASVAVNFGGTYSGSGLTGAAGAVMPPHSGLVLKRRVVTTPAPAPTPRAPPDAGRDADPRADAGRDADPARRRATPTPAPTRREPPGAHAAADAGADTAADAAAGHVRADAGRRDARGRSGTRVRAGRRHARPAAPQDPPDLRGADQGLLRLALHGVPPEPRASGPPPQRQGARRPPRREGQRPRQRHRPGPPDLARPQDPARWQEPRRGRLEPPPGPLGPGPRRAVGPARPLRRLLKKGRPDRGATVCVVIRAWRSFSGVS